PMLFRTVSKNIKKGTDMINTITATHKNSTAGEKLYDLSMVEVISGGDKSFIKRMVQLFLDTVPGTLSDIKNSCDKSEWSALSKHAHKLKSTIDSMNIDSVKQDIRTIESKSKTGEEADKIKELV